MMIDGHRCAQHDDVMMLLFAFAGNISSEGKELADLQLPRQAREMINRSTTRAKVTLHKKVFCILYIVK